MEISDIRRRYRAALDQARKASAERRSRSDAAASAYAAFLRDVATPVFRMFASVAKAEGQPFAVFTPEGGVRLASERNADDYIELWLDTSVDPPRVAVRTNRRHGGDQVTSERPLQQDGAIENLTDEDVLALLLSEFGPLVIR